MSDLFTSFQFWLGAAFLMCFQIGKYGELNDQDEDLKPWYGAVPNLRARHFLGFQNYIATLLLFLLATFAGYVVACLVSPSIISGWQRVTANPAAAETMKAYLDSVPYPLFIAAAFMGLTNQSIPGFSKVANLQRDVFHELVGVPRMVASTATTMSIQLLVKHKSDPDRIKQIQQWTSPVWEESIRDIVDLSFYDAELKRRSNALSSFEKTQSDLLVLFRELIYVMAIAAARNGGGADLRRLAGKLGVDLPERKNPFKELIVGALISVVALTVLCFAIPMAAPAVDWLNGSRPLSFWPQDAKALRASSIYVVSQCIPVLIASGLLFVSLPSAQAGTTLNVRGVIEKNAGKLLIIMCAVIVFDYAQLISDYGIYNPYLRSAPIELFASWIPYNIAHSIISISVCVVLLHYLSRGEAKTPGVSIVYILVMAAVALTTSCFYALVRLRYDFKVEVTLDYLFIVCLLNLVAAMIALFMSQSLYHGRILKSEVTSHPSNPAHAI
ncbi:hypothetical protein ELG69_27240 (plasmid) [Rhizobium leguminosarum]|uniref:hypothetical protein n=1 Tax=Rhizobium leguminosarum TaxID=384 RepID=UPI00102FE053|nr:hypothetical protein [Rhizobium leguminosarum]TBG75763.1 hypothetical protein ELG69_27240 [Rhizobium leguminosarum]